MDIGVRVKFKTMGGWYNSGVIKDIDDNSCLVEVDTLGCVPPKDIPLPYYARLSIDEIIEIKEE